MSFQRNPEHVILVTPESHAVDCLIDPPALTGVACLTQHPSPVPAENKLDMKREPPANVSAMHRWGADRKDYKAIFSFWKNWIVHDFFRQGNMCFLDAGFNHVSADVRETCPFLPQMSQCVCRAVEVQNTFYFTADQRIARTCRS